MLWWGEKKLEKRVRENKKWEGGEIGGMIMSPTSDTSSCFYGDLAANQMAPSEDCTTESR